MKEMGSHVFEISDSNFIWNTGSNGAAVNLQFYNSGAIVKVIDSVFDQNLAKHFGGAINIRVHGAHQSGENMYIYIHHSNFINNAVKFNSKGSGAAIQVTVTNYELQSDFSYSISVTMRNLTYVNSTSDGDGGAVSLILPSSNSNVLITECQFIKNKCGRYSRGGAIAFRIQTKPTYGF